MIINITHLLILLAIILIIVLVKINCYDKNRFCLEKEIANFHTLQKKYIETLNSYNQIT